MTLTPIHTLTTMLDTVAELAPTRPPQTEKAPNSRMQALPAQIDRPTVAADEPSADGVSARDIYALMVLFSKTAQHARTACRNMRQEELDAFQNAAGLAAEAMREAGRQRFVGSLVAGAGQALGGVVQIGGGVYGAVTTMKATALQSKANVRNGHAEQFSAVANSKVDPREAAALESYARAIREKSGRQSADAQFKFNNTYNVNMAAGGVPGIAGAASGAAKGAFDLAAAEEDAKRLIFETQSRVSENRMQAEERVMQDRYAEMQDLREKLNAIAQARLETNRTVARNF